MLEEAGLGDYLVERLGLDASRRTWTTGATW